MSSPSPLALVALVMLMTLMGVCQAASSSKDYKNDARNITYCDSGASDMGGFEWSLYRGRWYVSRVSKPLGRTLQDVQGYAVEIDASSIEPNAKDKAWRGVTVERKEILVRSDSRKCQKRSWQCVREQGSSRTYCRLGSDGIGVIEQRSVVMATDYTTTAAVYRETSINGRFLSKQINIMVRDPGMDPDPSVISSALKDYCGYYAAQPNGEFYKSISTSGSDLSCFLP